MKKLNLTQMTIILVAGYLLCQIVADITAVKIVGPVFGQFVPAAVFIYAVTFTWRDLVHKQLGKSAAVTLVWTAGIVNVLMAGYFVFTSKLSPAPFWPNQVAYESILGIVPRIVVASILAEIVSELLDTEVYHLLCNRWQWLRVLSSNSLALVVDSVIFVTLAFYGTMPNDAVFDIAKGQIVIKTVITLVSLPLIYLIPERNDG